MKIALCFAGQPRFIDLMNFDNLIHNHDVDVYAHFWWDESYRGQQFAWNSSLTYPENYDPIEHFKEKISPKKIVFEKYPEFDMTRYKMISQMEFSLEPNIVEQSIYRQKCQWKSVKRSIELVEGDYDLVVRMRTDLEFKDIVPLELCNQDGIYLMDGSLQAGYGRDYCDWFYCGPLHRMKEFDILKVYDDFYKDGIRHMHHLIDHTLVTLQIPHAVVDLKAWMLDRTKLETKDV